MFEEAARVGRMALLLHLQFGALIAAAAAACSTEADCAYNGQCVAGTCACAPQWLGKHCERLAVLPASKTAGFRSPHAPDAPNISSWGGSALYDEVGKQWHLYSAEFILHCGIDDWEPNSRVVHAVADSAEGPYTFADVVVDPFAHEPNAVRSPDGDWVIYMTMRHPPGFQVNCTDKPPAPPPPLSLVSATKSNPPPRHTYMVHSKTPTGPWTEPVLVLKANYSIWDNHTALIDTNLAIVILDSGAAVGIWRKCENTKGTVCEDQCCTFPHLLTASNWKDPSTYYPHADHQMFAGIKPYGAEDPMLWLQPRVATAEAPDGHPILHAILHDEQGPNRCTAIGRHAFSDDLGTSWTYAQEDAYNGTVAWRGGGESALYRRERPHMIVSQKGEALFISNGVQEVTSSDRSWTLIQPVSQHMTVSDYRV